MKLTNKYNLPEALYNAINKEWYSGERNKAYSVTEIINPTRIVTLTRRFWDELEEDVVDRIYTVLGSAVHNVIERANNENEQRFLTEMRLYHTTKNGCQLSGQCDLYDKKYRSLQDWKLTSVYTWIYRNRKGGRKDDWTKQLNMYRFLMEKNGYPVDELQINLIFRDHQKSSAKYDRSYPSEVETVDIPIYGLDVVDAMIEEKISELEYYKDKPESELPICSAEERWQGQDTWAVMKKGNKKATKVVFSWSTADDFIKSEAEKAAMKSKDYDTTYKKTLALYSISKRQAEAKRCLDYCPVREFCTFGRSLKK